MIPMIYDRRHDPITIRFDLKHFRSLKILFGA